MSVASPYKGLAPFDDSDVDARLFFGRERDAEIVTANLIASRLTVLYGPSGVGKSSLLRASVARSLRALPEAPLVVAFSDWAGDPVAALAAAVAGAARATPADGLAGALDAQRDRDVYLLLDQVEEYFLYHPHGGAFEESLAEVLGGRQRVSVLLSLREDALARLDRFKARIPGLFGNVLRLDRLDRDAARLAVVRPLEAFSDLTGEQVGAEPGLVERVLDEVGSGRIATGVGGLGAVPANGGPYRAEAPYLQLVMQRLWEVERAGGRAILSGAALDRLGGARRIVRDHLERAVGDLPPAQQDVAAAVFAHLVTPSGTKIAHSADDLAEYAGVPAADVTEVTGPLVADRVLRPAEGGRVEIFHDVLAGEVLDWRRRHDAGRLVERERANARRRHRRVAVVAAAALVAVACLAVLTAWALGERSNAREQAREARSQALAANALLALDDDPQLSLLLATEASRLSSAGIAADVLRRALLEDRLRLVLPADGAVTDVDYDASGSRTVVAGAGGEARVYDAGDGRLLHRLRQAGPVAAAAYAPDGSLVATAGGDGAVHVWDAGTGAPTLTVPGPAPAVGVSLQTLAGERVVLAVTRALVTVARLRDGDELARIEPGVAVREALLTAEGGMVAVRSVDRFVRVYGVRGRTVKALDQGSRVDSLAVASRGAILASGGADGSVFLWDAVAGRRLGSLVGHSGAVLDLAFSADGGRLVSASADGTARTWDVAERRTLQVFSGHTNYVTSAAFSPRRGAIVTGSSDGTARTWDAGGRMAAVLAGHDAQVTDATFSPDGARVLSGGADGTARVWDSGTRPDLTPGGSAPAPPALTATGPGGDVRARADGNVVRLTGPGGTRVLSRHADRVNALSFSPDGRRLVTAGRDHEVIVWDVASGEPTVLERAHFGSVADVRFSPDGRWLVTAGPISAGLWDASTGAFLTYLRGPATVLTAAAFTPDSRTIVSVEQDGTVRRYACEVCASAEDLVRLAEQRLAVTGRTLTPEERARYLG